MSGDMFGEILNKKIECSCGRTHRIGLKKVIIEKGAREQLPEILGELTELKKILLICDENTYRAAGKKAEEILEQNFRVEKLIFKGKVRPEPANIFKILEKYTGEEYLLACGSGTINDMTRYVSCKVGQPYSVVATAPSMDGYASSVSCLTVDGVKKTYPTVPAEAVIADIDVLKNAPSAMKQAGYGDLLGKITSILDWKLSRILYGEYYCQLAVDLVERELNSILNRSRKKTHTADKVDKVEQDNTDQTKTDNIDLMNQDNKNQFQVEETDRDIELLMQGIIYSGLSILMVGSSRPASGSEHHISHFLEMYGEIYERETPPHGVKVGLGTFFSTGLYQYLVGLDFARVIVKLDKGERINNIRKFYGERSGPVLENLEERWNRERLTQEKFLTAEREIKELIAEYSEKLAGVRKMIVEMGLLEREDVRSLPGGWLDKALRYGFEIRSRYTVTSLLNQIGHLDSAAKKLIEEYRQICETRVNS